MIKVGDKVKVINKCSVADGVDMEMIPIGTICEVKKVTTDGCYGLEAIEKNNYGLWWYVKEQIESI